MDNTRITIFVLIVVISTLTVLHIMLFLRLATHEAPAQSNIFNFMINSLRHSIRDNSTRVHPNKPRFKYKFGTFEYTEPPPQYRVYLPEDHDYARISRQTASQYEIYGINLF
ncbi:hypothetical protein O0L34_g18941 [Tuta absoluta]|nr:hypothetical protein O0L34_g18941 [Tuta absoluta]